LKHTTWLSSLVLTLAACGGGAGSGPAQPATTASAAAPAARRAQQLASLYAEFWEENLKLNPIQATMIGDPRYNDQLPNSLSAEHRARAPAPGSRAREGDRW
jgi:hypothetical protein